MHTHTHDSQHLRETRLLKRGTESFGLFGACHSPRGFAEVFFLKSAFQGFGPEGLDTACDIDDWKTDAYNTDASDDHQSSDGTPSENDMDVAADNDDEKEPDEDCMWVLPEVEIPDEPRSSKCTIHTSHYITVLFAVTIRSEDYDHGKIVAGLEALQESAEGLLLEEEWTMNDSVEHASLQRRIKQIFDTARIGAKED